MYIYTPQFQANIKYNLYLVNLHIGNTGSDPVELHLFICPR
jgi:hypothetical protein